MSGHTITQRPVTSPATDRLSSWRRMHLELELNPRDVYTPYSGANIFLPERLIHCAKLSIYHILKEAITPLIVFVLIQSRPSTTSSATQKPLAEKAETRIAEYVQPAENLVACLVEQNVCRVVDRGQSFFTHSSIGNSGSVDRVGSQFPVRDSSLLWLDCLHVYLVSRIGSLVVSDVDLRVICPCHISRGAYKSIRYTLPVDRVWNCYRGLQSRHSDLYRR
jgi:hypothetical protein